MSGKSKKGSRSRLEKAKAKVGDLADQVKKLLGKNPATAGVISTVALIGLYFGRDKIKLGVENIIAKMGGGKQQATEMLRSMNAALVVLIERAAVYVEGTVPLAGPVLKKLANSLKFSVPPVPAPAAATAASVAAMDPYAASREWRAKQDAAAKAKAAPKKDNLGSAAGLFQRRRSRKSGSRKSKREKSRGSRRTRSRRGR